MRLNIITFREKRYFLVLYHADFKIMNTNLTEKYSRFGNNSSRLKFQLL